MGTQEHRTVFDSGLAKPYISNEEAMKILQAHELVKECEIISEEYIQVELKKPIGWGELHEFRRNLMGKGIEFQEKHSLKPLQS